MTAVDELGYLAASLVLATFCAKSMVLLRVLAIASNIAFVAYGYVADLWPIFLIHSVMLPLNCLRLREALGARTPLKLNPRGSGLARPTAASQPIPDLACGKSVIIAASSQLPPSPADRASTLYQTDLVEPCGVVV